MFPCKNSDLAIENERSRSSIYPRTQLKELCPYAKRRSLRVAHKLDDYESGAKDKRPELDKLLDVVRKRQGDAVLAWKFDQATRSTKQLLRALDEFRQIGIVERSLIRERVKALTVLEPKASSWPRRPRRWHHCSVGSASQRLAEPGWLQLGIPRSTVAKHWVSKS